MASGSANRRIQKVDSGHPMGGTGTLTIREQEYADLQANPVENVTLNPDEKNILHWTGPLSTLSGRQRLKSTDRLHRRPSPVGL